MSRPPDPKGLNDKRAALAETAVRAFERACNARPEDAEDAVSDLLCDLRHFLDRNPEYGTFDDAVYRAGYNYDAETRKEN